MLKRRGIRNWIGFENKRRGGWRSGLDDADGGCDGADKLEGIATVGKRNRRERSGLGHRR